MLDWSNGGGACGFGRFDDMTYLFSRKIKPNRLFDMLRRLYICFVAMVVCLMVQQPACAMEAAGVVAMGMEDISFAWYMKHITPLVLLGYFAGILCYWIMA